MLQRSLAYILEKQLFMILLYGITSINDGLRGDMGVSNSQL